jgi:hypothetical protein
MRRRRLLVALAGLAVVIVAGVVVLWPWASPTTLITPENYLASRSGCVAEVPWAARHSPT